jgi:hypothetical protein
LFKRIVIALIATYFFAFQIYCDFSGYSDIAVGSARLFGVELMQNFDRPYLSRSIREFWSRWHISLSTWFRDYLYIPPRRQSRRAGAQLLQPDGRVFGQRPVAWCGVDVRDLGRATRGACGSLLARPKGARTPACALTRKSKHSVASSDYECDEDLDCPDDSDEFPVNASCKPVWTCNQGWYGDGDCGCGIRDLDCTGTTDENECEFCVACQGNAIGCDGNQVDPANTT